MDFMDFHNKEGSALILLMSVLFFLTLLVGAIVRMTVYGADIVACRQRTIEQSYATEALLLYAIVLCNENSSLCKNGNDRTIYDGPWFENRHISWRGKVALTLKDGVGFLHARLCSASACVAEQKCQVLYSDGVMKITVWNI